MGKLKATTDKDFEKDVLKSTKPVLVDFWAEWCGPCRMLTPVLEQMAEKYADKMEIVKFNVDENPMYAAKYNIRSIPTLILFKDGKPVTKQIGYVPYEMLSRAIEKFL